MRTLTFMGMVELAEDSESQFIDSMDTQLMICMQMLKKL